MNLCFWSTVRHFYQFFSLFIVPFSIYTNSFLLAEFLILSPHHLHFCLPRINKFGKTCSHKQITSIYLKWSNFCFVVVSSKNLFSAEKKKNKTNVNDVSEYNERLLDTRLKRLKRMYFTKGQSGQTMWSIITLLFSTLLWWASHHSLYSYIHIIDSIQSDF